MRLKCIRFEIQHAEYFLLVFVVFSSITPTILAIAPDETTSAPIHTTYLWHMHQPIYWPDISTWYPVRYETAYETITLGHSENDVYSIFDKDDRVHDYQNYPRDAVSSVLDIPDAGAQVSFAAALIENVKSLADAGWNGGRYAPNWYADYRTARGWMTSGGHSRLEQLIVAAHHPIAPLMDENALRKEIKVAKAAYSIAWGDNNYSNGYFPAEMCFSERMIPILKEEGIDWSIVADIHISRACANYPYAANEDNCDPPNDADKLNPAQAHYDEIAISRGVTVKTPPPFGFTPHRARYVDPATGIADTIVVVPAANAMSWNEGYGTYGTGEIDAISSYNDPVRPMLILFAHDGDNSWAGGYSYYNENVTGFCHDAVNRGYKPSTIAQYLDEFPVPAADIVHVEDGGWVNADGDFGSPQFINWNWPLVDENGNFDIPNGWAEDERNWAVLTAAENRVETAEAIYGAPPDPMKIFDPTLGANEVEMAWHHMLSGYESGYMYYGASLDMEVKATLAANAAASHADPVILGGEDETPPTIWLPQRLPWNPGGRGGGSLWGYPGGDGAAMTSDFYVWTFAYDVSGLARVELKYRFDADGINSTSTDDNETYAGGPDVGSWITLPMTRRIFPKGNYLNDPNIDFSVLPTYIADEYYVQVKGLSNVLIDYYVEAEDSLGLVKQSPIQHVWIGEQNSSPAHTIDGTLDTNSTLVASNVPFHLYADWDGTFLYVAADGAAATEGLDHFILIGTDTIGSVSAPWAKSGYVASRTLYLANEESNNWCGWFDISENVISNDASSASGDFLEGTIRLDSYLGTPLPEKIFLAFAAYQTPDGGNLAGQAPAGNGDGDIEVSEYIPYSLVTTSVREAPGSNSAILLMPVRPNPFGASTLIRFFLPAPAYVNASVYDVTGRRVRLLASGIKNRGWNELRWDGKTSNGSRASAGIYFVRLSSARGNTTRKVILLR